MNLTSTSTLTSEQPQEAGRRTLQPIPASTSRIAGAGRVSAAERARELAQLPQEGIVRLYGSEPDAGVDGDAAVGAGDDRVEVECGHFRQVVGQAGDPERDIGDRVEIRRGDAAVGVA